VEAPHKTIRRRRGGIVTVATTIRSLQTDYWYFYLLRLNGLRSAKNLALAGAALYVLYCNIMYILLN